MNIPNPVAPVVTLVAPRLTAKQKFKAFGAKLMSCFRAAEADTPTVIADAEDVIQEIPVIIEDVNKVTTVVKDLETLKQ